MNQENATVSAELPMQRLFFALFLPEDAAKALHRHAEPLAAQCRARLMHPGSLHMTLAFLGAVPEIDVRRLLEAAAVVSLNSRQIDLRIDRYGYWSHNRILWAGCSLLPDALASLAGELATALRAEGFVLDRRAFLPHVTLLRRCETTPSTEEAPDIACSLGEFQLVASQTAANGARYRSVARWPLGERLAGAG
jgi:RNA 2',3'-cyclic 3'-phosphodiesterase